MTRDVLESRWCVLPIVVLALVLLSIGVTLDYRLKHEDNNAMHAAFARDHLLAGFGVTRAQDAFVNPDNGRVTFYAHHPPGCGLLLAGAFAITGSDRPVVVRSVAIAATLLTLILLWRLVRREEGPRAALVAAAAFAILPQAAFYGRMVNHEVLALPAIVLLVDRYFATARGGGWRTTAGLATAAAVGALLAWVTFFAIAACAVHAVLSIRRLGSGQDYGALEWTRKMFGFSRRLATLSGTLALVVVEVLATSAVGLSTRHTTPEDRVIEAVTTFRSRSLSIEP